MGEGAQYFPLLVLKRSLIRPVILRWPEPSSSPLSPLYVQKASRRESDIIRGNTKLLGTNTEVVQRYLIHTSTQPAIFGQCLLCFLFGLEVSNHHTRASHLYLAINRYALFYSWMGLADISDFAPTRLGNVRIVEVLCHAISLQELEAKIPIPC